MMMMMIHLINKIKNVFFSDRKLMGLLLVLFLLLEQLPVDDDDRLRRFNFLIKTSKRRKKSE
jgi:hypothetical protein